MSGKTSCHIFPKFKLFLLPEVGDGNSGLPKRYSVASLYWLQLWKGGGRGL